MQHDLYIDQMDVVTTFLQSELEEEIYMKIPEGFNADKKKTFIKSSLSKNFKMKDIGEATTFWV